MPLTLADANKLSNDVLLSGVIETIVNESPVLSVLPWSDVVGTAVTYNRENGAATVAWRAVGDTWTEDAPTITQVTVALKILGGDADVDKFLQQSRADKNDLEAVVTQLKAKALAYEFEDRFIYGNASADPNGFDGIHRQRSSAMVINQGAATVPGALSLANLDTLIDKIKPGRPDMLLMSKRTRRLISAYMRANSSPVNFTINEFGHRVMNWDQVPIFVSDFITDTEAISGGAFNAKTGGTGSSIFAIRFGEDGLAGLKNGPFPIIEKVGTLETKDAARTRIKAYCTVALYDTLALAVIDGVSGGAVVA